MVIVAQLWDYINIVDFHTVNVSIVWYVTYLKIIIKNPEIQEYRKFESKRLEKYKLYKRKLKVSWQ